ncbi:hypothetical protein [Chryseobacterium caseinilyticum]|uniref:DUF4126 family protein n=1 Tax=Chryseobacterium caseinilyticum TaxID=2771428 RepID=A0ABR8Z8G0_9FLAO|nr:hypothetical protein [Chryseobacterium caseinilyticum]MBD8081513.1 hypothetical protein [Chryseobacterium caseinilyticum]
MLKKMIAGLGGAVALNLLHEIVRKTCKDVPHINELGEEALSKMTDRTALEINNPNQLYAATLAGDVISNAVYYATTATTHNLASGLLAGVGAIALPQKLGLDPDPVASTNKKKIMTVGYYLFGAIVTKLIYDQIKDNE